MIEKFEVSRLLFLKKKAPWQFLDKVLNTPLYAIIWNTKTKELSEVFLFLFEKQCLKRKYFFNHLTPRVPQATLTETNLWLSAAGLLKYVGLFIGP